MQFKTNNKSFFDTSTGHLYTPIYADLVTDTLLCRCREDGYYYVLTKDDVVDMLEHNSPNEEVIKALEDKEQGRLRVLTRKRA